MYLSSGVTLRWSEKVSYTVAALGSDVGGLAGLMLGASVLTVLQIVESLGSAVARLLVRLL